MRYICIHFKSSSVFTGAVKKNKKLAADQKTDVSIRLSVMNHLRFSRAPKTAEEEKN